MVFRKCGILLLVTVLVLMFFGCSSQTNADRFSLSVQDSSIGDSRFSYNNKDWFDFVRQDEEIQNYYLNYLEEIGECLSTIELEKTSEEEFDGVDTMLIELDKDSQHYEFNLKHVYPDTGYLMISISNKAEYYFLDKESSCRLSEVIFESETRPFNHITLLEYLENDNEK